METPLNDALCIPLAVSVHDQSGTSRHSKTVGKGNW